MVLVEQRVRAGAHPVYVSTRRTMCVLTSQPPSNLVCTACRDVFVAPRMSPCGHSLCASCLPKTVGVTGSCPACGAAVDTCEYFEDVASARAIAQLRTYCRHALGVRRDADGNVTAILPRQADPDACQETVTLGEKAEHERQCAFAPHSCPNFDVAADGGEDRRRACGWRGVRRDFEAHAAVCEHRVAPCPFRTSGCAVRCSVHLLRKHAEHCDFRSVPCEQGCGALVVRNNMREHIQNECRRTTVVCGACAPQQEEADEAEAADALDTAGGGGNDGGRQAPRACEERLPRHLLEEHRRTRCLFCMQINCKHCHKPFVKALIGAHEGHCGQARVPCPNDCGRYMARRALPNHLADECTAAVLPCRFAELGCCERVPRGAMRAHMQHAAERHIELLADALIATRREAKASTRTLGTLDSDVQTMAKRLTTDTAAAVDGVDARVSREMETLRAENAALRTEMTEGMQQMRAQLQAMHVATSNKLLALCHDMMEYRTALREVCTEDSAAISEMRTDWASAKEQLQSRCDNLVVAVARLAASTEQGMRAGLDQADERMELRVRQSADEAQHGIDEARFATATRLTDLWEHVQTVGKQGVEETMRRRLRAAEQRGFSP